MENKKKDRTNWRLYLNIGTIVFFLIVVYLAGNLVRYARKKNLAVYEVSNSEISDTIRSTGVILREEKIFKTKEEGYIHNYLPDGDKVRNGGIVYTLDKTGKIQEEVNRIIENSHDAIRLESSSILDDLKVFTDSYSDSDFYMVEDTDNQLEHDLLSYTGTLLSENKKELEKKYGKDCYIEVRSKQSGLVSYSSDGLEGLTQKNLTKKDITGKVHMTDLRTNEKAKPGTVVYRLTTSQEWQIILPLTKDDYARMKSLEENGVSKVKITIEKDDFQTTAPFSCFEKEDQGYLKLSFSNYVQRYLNQRYLSVKLLLAEGRGLKIPASSLVERGAFRVPEEYLTKGSNSETRNHVNLIYKDKKGKEKVRQITVKVFDAQDGMVSIYSNELSRGDRIVKVEDATTYSLDKVSVSYGVYTVNSGYAVFSHVDISERNEDYCIVNEATSEIKLYDRIVLNSNTISENEIIY